MTIQQQYQQTKVIGRAANGSNAITMTSLDFLNNIINPARDVEGESPLRNTELLRKLEDECDDLGVVQTFCTTTSQGAKRQVKGYTLNFDQMMLIGMRESKAVRRAVLAKLKTLEGQLAQPQWAIPQTLPEALRLAAEQAEQVAILTIENKQQQEQIHSLESLFRQGMTIPQFCKMLNGVNVMKVTEYLADERHWLFNESRSGLNKRWRVASYARDRYLTEEQQEIRSHGHESFVKYTAVLLQAGAVRLYQLYRKGKLPMKASWDGLFTQDKVIKVAA
jgi:phage antirepressor YoqD-like protein